MMNRRDFFQRALVAIGIAKVAPTVVPLDKSQPISDLRYTAWSLEREARYTEPDVVILPTGMAWDSPYGRSAMDDQLLDDLEFIRARAWSTYLDGMARAKGWL